MTGEGDPYASDLSRIGTDGLRPAALVVAVLFVAFTIYNGIAMPAPACAPMVAYDLALVALGIAIYVTCRRATISVERAHLGAAALSFGVMGNILLSAALGVSPMFTLYTAVLVVASAGSVVSGRWALAIVLVEVAGWAVVAVQVIARPELVQNCFVVMTSLGAAFVVHVGRSRARTRILELRSGDAMREAALHQALAEADEARRGLDLKVEERTSELRRELDQRRRLEAQLRHAQKLEAIGRLAGGIAHDFNNLLTVIRMSLGTLAEPDVSLAEARNALRDASDATDRAAGLTHDLLAFARKQTLERTTIPVVDILGVVERMVRRIIDASIRLEVRVAPDTGDVLADRHQIEQVLLNLAINACDAMDNRGTLTVTADMVHLDGGEAEARRLTPATYVRVAVSDTGTGIDPKAMSSLFEPFFTTKEIGRGTGLGLAVAHGIVTQHGGEIVVESELGAGSTFTVFLPRSVEVAAPGGGHITEVPAASAHETVLVVEDEPGVRRGLQRYLQRFGYRVLIAQDGEEAIRIADSQGPFDLVLSDVVMPGIDGPELAGRLRRRWPDLPVLFVTGYSRDRLAHTGAVGARDRILEKPFQLDELARTIRLMLERPGSM